MNSLVDRVEDLTLVGSSEATHWRIRDDLDAILEQAREVGKGINVLPVLVDSLANDSVVEEDPRVRDLSTMIDYALIGYDGDWVVEKLVKLGIIECIESRWEGRYSMVGCVMRQY